MKLTTIDCGNFMCDGGAAFGIIPKTMWAKEYPADEDNLINLAMRSLLVENGERVAIVDTGMGNGYFGSISATYFGLTVPPISVQTVPLFAAKVYRISV